ncbi:MAG: pyrroline-5-carboxylate reductase [Candidatus Omnitrophica bacterium]|nr:pyrroline-5-carboxylate reductase [Candidatus Omnitrophota bacterium]MBU1932934.1 pyrroline-5-carboxylate reductase [Candidatus Omnitrophota bacterium]
MIGIIGAGNMGKAIASGMGKKVMMSDAVRSKLNAAKKIGVTPARDNIDLVKRSKVVILAVKPQDIAAVLKEIKPHISAKLVISIAAGVKSVFIEKALGKVRVIRVMPNMPALVGRGISAVTTGRFARKQDIVTARGVFSKLGEVVEVRETLMDAVTAVSGSGPAYYFLFTDLLERAGIKAGLKKGLARKLAMATFTGAAESARTSNVSMRDFAKKVASKGGTTEAALNVFKKKKLGYIIEQAVKAARDKSRSLLT